MGFGDFAGSTIVHSVGGWAALTGAIIIGARKGRFVDNKSIPMPIDLPLATLGTFILWMGWFGFGGGSQLAMGSAADVIAIATIYMNTNLAAASGVVTVILTLIMYKKVDLTMALSALGGLVAIGGAAGPVAAHGDHRRRYRRRDRGADGSASRQARHRRRRERGSGSPVRGHLGHHRGRLHRRCEHRDADHRHRCHRRFRHDQRDRLGMLGMILGLRPSEEDSGLDRTECGLEAYPEFGSGSQTI